MAFSARQNAENEHCETLKKLVHILKFQRYTLHIQDIKCGGIRVLLF